MNHEHQFSLLISHLAVSVNQALAQGTETPPLALTLSGSDEIDMGFGIDEGKSLGEAMDVMQKALKQRVLEQPGIEAALLGYPVIEEREFHAFLENRNNLCMKVSIPVVEQDGALRLQLDDLREEAGAVYVFPLQEE